MVDFNILGTMDKILKLDEELEAIGNCILYLVSQPVIVQSHVDAAVRIDKKLSRQRRILEKRLNARTKNS